MNETIPAIGEGACPGVVYLVGGGPGDPSLVTLRGAELLRTADVVLHDELLHPALLELARGDAEVRSVGKRGGDPGAKQTSQSSIEADLVALARAGRSVVRLKGGDPFLFGRGSEEVEALARAAVPFEVVPGVASPLGATAYAGISLTHRDLASSVTFVSGTTRAGTGFDWSELSRVRGTICVLMGMRRIDEIVSRLAAGTGRAPTTPCAVIRWGTRAEQETVVGTLGDIAPRVRERGIGSPALLVVGEVVELRRAMRWFDTRPLFGKRVLVTRAKGQASATSRLLRSRGAEPVEWPAIELGPPPDVERVRRAAREVGAYDVVIFTSENGVERFFAALDGEGRDARAFGAARVAAVGSATAAALASRGVRADIVPGAFVGDRLAEAILQDRPIAEKRSSGARVRALVPRALVAREALPDLLRSAGVDVDIVPVYETRPPPAARRDELIAALEGRRVEAALFTSSSTAENLCALLGERAAELLAPVVVASIGPITTKAAEARGLRVAVTAEVSTTAGLLGALEAYFAGRVDAAPRSLV